ncbi:hypothetical protein BH23GEM3_BH23GEM3_03770 [soil metagenome]|nr:Smr/MutS family protein [Gemmatimonadota bacterium]
MARRRRRPSSSKPPSPGAREAIFPSLDLHGHTADEAVLRTRRWLREQQDLGVPVVRVITGRGLRSVGPPVLRGEIDALLGTLRGTLITEYVSESAGGAFRVELRPVPKRARLQRESGASHPAAGRAPLDAALRHRAEEELAELGIQPTPELIQAQVQHILRRRADRPA